MNIEMEDTSTVEYVDSTTVIDEEFVYENKNKEDGDSDNIVVGRTINEAVVYSDLITSRKVVAQFGIEKIVNNTDYSLTESGIAAVNYNPADFDDGKPDAQYWQKKYKMFCAVPFKVVDITNIYTLASDNTLDIASSNSSRRKVTIVAHDHMDGVNYRMELPMHAFQNTQTAMECLKDFAGKGMSFGLEPSNMPRLQEYLALSTKKCYDEKTTPDKSLYEGSGWVLDANIPKEERYKHLLTYTAPGLSNNTKQNGWRHTNGDEERMKRALRCAITNTGLSEQEPTNPDHALINEIAVIAMAWSVAGMLRVKGLADHQESQILSLVGTTGGDGKSSLMDMVSALHGDRIGDGINTQDTTLLSLKDTIREGNHSTIFIDEFTNISDSRQSAKASTPDEFRRIVMGLTEIATPGRRKMKDAKEASGFTIYTDNPAWVVYFACMNGSINSKIMGCKDNQAGPIAARNIEVMVIRSEEHRNGAEGHVIFRRNLTTKKISGLADADRAKYITELKNELRNHYGYGLPYFINYIKNNVESIKSLFAYYCNEYNSLGLTQNRQGLAYGMMETLKMPLLHYLGFSDEMAKHIGQKVTLFLKEHIVPHNNKIAESALGRQEVEETLDSLKQLVMNRLNMMEPTKVNMYLMGDDGDLKRMNASLTKDFSPWRPARKEWLQYDKRGDVLPFDSWTPNAQRCFAEFKWDEVRSDRTQKSWIRYEQLQPMSQPYHFDEAILVNVNINSECSTRTEVNIETLKKAAKEQGWLIQASNGKTKTKEKWSLSNNLYYKFNIAEANTLIQAADSNAIDDLDAMSDGDDVEA